MPDASDSTSMSRGLHVGTKICLLASVLLLLFAAYLYFVPINIPATQGVFGCGSAASPPTQDFAKGICQDLAGINRLRALILLIAALLTSGLGYVLFGTVRSGSGPAAEEPVALDPAGTDD